MNGSVASATLAAVITMVLNGERAVSSEHSWFTCVWALRSICSFQVATGCVALRLFVIQNGRKVWTLMREIVALSSQLDILILLKHFYNQCDGWRRDFHLVTSAAAEGSRLSIAFGKGDVTCEGLETSYQQIYHIMWCCPVVNDFQTSPLSKEQQANQWYTTDSPPRGDDDSSRD